MKTSHQLARALLARPDLPIFIGNRNATAAADALREPQVSEFTGGTSPNGGEWHDAIEIHDGAPMFGPDADIRPEGRSKPAGGLSALEAQMAHESAEAFIEGACLTHADPNYSDIRWIDISTADESDRPLVNRDFAYLSARDLVQRHPKNPTWFRVLACSDRVGAATHGAADTPPARVRIQRCSEPGAWYEALVGASVGVFGLDQYGYWTRDTGPLRCAQWIRVWDAVPA